MSALPVLAASLLPAASISAAPPPGQDCLPCHAREVARFAASAMAHSIGKPGEEPAGTIKRRDGASIQIVWKDGEMRHRVAMRGVIADYPIAFAFGAGRVGRSYAVSVGGKLYQSPASWYATRKVWDFTPGYESARVLDFTQPITRDCAFCHAGAMHTAADGLRDRPDALDTIGCERCHGPSAAHRKNPSSNNIVNPARLKVRERDSVCEQCHLKSAAVVLNPGKDWWDFRPGMELEDIATHYVERGGSGEVIAVSHAEQLSLSLCARSSGGKLWCGTCHDPHGPPIADRTAQIRGICESCHAAATLASNHSARQDDCVSCHMPRRAAADVAHAAVTDHRIERFPTPLPKPAGATTLVAWRDAAPGLADRNLGLGYFALAQKEDSAPDLRRALDLLSRSGARNDAAVLAARGYALLELGGAKAATKWFKQAAEVDSANVDYWLDLGVAENTAGDASTAVNAFEKAIALDRYDYRPYRALAQIYDRSGQHDRSEQLIRRYLQLVPESETMRLLQ